MRLKDAKERWESFLVTVKDVYGTDNPEAPEGYEFTGEFRPAKPGDVVLSVYRCRPFQSSADCDAPGTSPRLILKKSGPTVESVYGTPHPKIPAGYEPTGDFCAPKLGDWWLHPTGCICYQHYFAPARSAVLILRRIPRKRVIFEATGETRAPRKDEYVPEGSGFHQATRDWFPEFVRPIYTRREEEF